MSTLETLRLHSGTLLDLQVIGYNLKILLQQIGVQDAINYFHCLFGNVLTLMMGPHHV